MALKVFTSARAALEATRGTDLTPTRLIYGESFEHDQTIATIRPEELRNSYEGFFSASAGPERNTLAVNGRVSYDDLIWWANLFMKAVASGTGGAADKTWTFLPTVTADDVKTATIQLGYADTIATAPGIKLNYCIGDEFNLHFEKNDDGALTFSGKLLSAVANTQITAFTGSLSDRTVTLASANNTQVYLDATTIGTTADLNVTAVDWTVNLGPVPFYALNNSASASNTYRPNHKVWTATITRQFNSATEWSIYASKAERKVRVRTVGPALGGTNYKIDLDLYGVYTGRSWADVDGIITEQITMEPLWDTTALASHQLVVVNATASIT
jgi:hypothetical protein